MLFFIKSDDAFRRHVQASLHVLPVCPEQTSSLARCNNAAYDRIGQNSHLNGLFPLALAICCVPRLKRQLRFFPRC